MKTLIGYLSGGILLIIGLTLLCAVIEGAFVYVVWNFFCDMLHFSYWLSFWQAVAVGLVLTLITNFFKR